MLRRCDPAESSSLVGLQVGVSGVDWASQSPEEEKKRNSVHQVSMSTF